MCLGGGYLRSGTRHSCATSSAAGGVGEVMSLVARIWGGAKSVGVMVTLSINDNGGKCQHYTVRHTDVPEIAFMPHSDE